MHSSLTTHIHLWNRLRHTSFLIFLAQSASQTGWNGSGMGTVAVNHPSQDNPSQDILIFSEQGLWKPAQGKESRFKNVFRWTLANSKTIRLEHLRFGVNHPVYLFDLTLTEDGEWTTFTPHFCGEDVYSAKMRSHQSSLLLHWTITGPKKQESIEYRYW